MKTEHLVAVTVEACDREWVVELDWDLDGHMPVHIYLDQGEREWAEDNGPDLMSLLNESALEEIQTAAEEAAKEAADDRR